MARVLIAGCGYVGSEVASRLVLEDHHVWALRRSPAEPPPGVNPIAADLGDADSLRGLPQGLDFVCYTAAADGRSDDAYRAAYVLGVRNLLQALEAGGQVPRRVLFTSSTGVYGQSDGDWVDEDSPANPSEFTGQRVLEGERALFAGPYPAVALRLGGIYGPGRSRLISQIAEGSLDLRRGGRFTNRIHRDDAAGALIHLMGLDAPDPIYIGVDLEPATLALVARWLSREMGVEPGAPAADAVPSNKRCNSQRLVESGYRFLYPTFRSGYRAILRARQKGEIGPN